MQGPRIPPPELDVADRICHGFVKQWLTHPNEQPSFLQRDQRLVHSTA